MTTDFDSLVREAERQPFSGWDFSYLHGRFIEVKPSWDYIEIVREKMKGVKSMLDLGTGGGERFSQLQPFPKETFATEGYPPNVILARERLEPLGVQVIEAKEEGELPFNDDFFDLIIDRHTGHLGREVFRTLRPGGQFITQQIGWLNNREIHEFFQAERPERSSLNSLDKDWRDLEDAGLHVLVTRAESHASAFHDIGALVYYLKAIPWEVPGFSVEKFESKLRVAHEIIQNKGKFEVSTHHYMIEAEKISE